MTQLTTQHLKRNINLPDKRTSLVLDAYHWVRMDHILDGESISLDMLVQDIEMRRSSLSLASACRIFILMYMNCQLEKADTQKMVHNLGADTISMMTEPDNLNAPTLFQALSLLGRYAAQSA